jgi:hypothetical protein
MHWRTPVPRRPTMKRRALLALPLLAALGCMDTGPSTGPGGLSEQLGALLSDGSTDGEFQGFLFLPPLVGSPDKGGQSPIPGLAPHAEVCLLDTSGSEWVCEAGPAFRTFGPSAIAYDGDHYKVEWDTKDPAHGEILTSDPNGIQFTYRLTVFLGSLQLGFVDLQFGSNGGTAKNLSTNDVVGLKDGRTVPVNFFIGGSLETDLGCITGYDCQVATFPAGEETLILTRDGDAVLYIPAGATSGTGTIVARIAEVPADMCDLGVDLPWYNSCYEYDLFPDQVLSMPVIVAQCIDTSSVPAGRLGELQLGARHDDPPAGIPEFELLANVASPATLSCDDYVPGPAPTGFAALLKGVGRVVADFVFGTPVYAGHSGLGGAPQDLSTIAWVDPGLRIAGFNTQRGGFSSLSSAEFLPAMQALEATYPNVWRDTASTITSTLLDGDVDVVLLATGFNNAGAIAALSAAEQSALFEYVEHGGCAILLPDNDSFGGAGTDAVNESLINVFGLSVTGTLNFNQTATVTGTGAAVQGITSFTQNYPGWFDGLGQAPVAATELATNQGGPAMVEIAAGVLGPHSGPVFAFSDINAFWGGTSGRFTTGQNAQLFLNTVNACGTEPLP